MNRLQKRLLLLSTGMVTLFQCTNLVGNGGGSDVGNGIITGSLQNEDGTPATATKIVVLPYLFNPASDPLATFRIIDTTDETGSFRVPMPTSGIYNIEATSLQRGTRTFFLEALVRTGDTVRLGLHPLKDPGRITVFLPDSIDTASGYLFIQGTTHWIPLTKSHSLVDGGYAVTLDSMPAATLPSIHYACLGMAAQPVPISDTLTVASNDIAVVDALVSWKHYTSENSDLPPYTIQDILIMPDRTTWFATAGGGAVRLSRDTMTVFTTDNSLLPSNDVRDIAYENNGTIWFVTAQGVAVFIVDKWIPATSFIPWLPSSNLTSVQVDREGFKWFGTADAGLMQFNGFSWIVFDTTNSLLPSNTITQVLADDGPWVPGGLALWCATPQGAAVLNQNQWTVFNTRTSGIRSNEVHCIAIDQTGTIWFGHDNGVSRLYGSEWTIYDQGTAPSLGSQVMAIHEDSRGNLWFGTVDGVVRFDQRGWTSFYGDRYRLIEHESIYSLAIDAANATWIGTAHNGIIVFGSYSRHRDPLVLR
ncbi:MAG: hypothetical protein JW768_07495 [Chitinispirillaceae bacterium]|nr:hypothetical protein [Chitinispirillaceae bacterium]